jgi:hypothetical protein
MASPPSRQTFFRVGATGLAAMIAGGNARRSACGVHTDSMGRPGLPLPGRGTFACTSLRRVRGALLKAAREEGWRCQALVQVSWAGQGPRLSPLVGMFLARFGQRSRCH